MRKKMMMLFAFIGCTQNDIGAMQELPNLNEAFFRCEVQPVLATSCAFMACHGNAERPFSIYAEQRFRINTSWDDYEDEITVDELSTNFRVVRSFVPWNSSDINLLTEKPLDTRAGGLFHQGRDLYGTDDVYMSTEDPGYKALVELSEGATSAIDCIPREDLRL